MSGLRGRSPLRSASGCMVPAGVAHPDGEMETTGMVRGQRESRMPSASSIRWQERHAIADPLTKSREKGGEGPAPKPTPA
jgi:hypothetical protein